MCVEWRWNGQLEIAKHMHISQASIFAFGCRIKDSLWDYVDGKNSTDKVLKVIKFIAILNRIQMSKLTQMDRRLDSTSFFIHLEFMM